MRKRTKLLERKGQALKGDARPVKRLNRRARRLLARQGVKVPIQVPHISLLRKG